MSASDVLTAGDTAIRDLGVHFSDEELADLDRRVEATRWPARGRSVTTHRASRWP
jgi:hypothetical protein